MTAPDTRPPHRSAHVALTALGGLGIAALLLPFSFDVTPLEAMTGWKLWQLALPGLLPLLILPATASWLRSGTLTPLVRVVSYVLAAVTALDTLSLYRDLLGSAPFDLQGWLLLLGPIAILALGGLVLRRVRRAGSASGYAPILALQVTYIAHAMLVCVGEYSSWQTGAYLVLATMGAYALQIDLIRKAAERVRSA